MNIYKEANYKLDCFIRDKLLSYHQFRNYDYGINNRSNVSQISKYISHGILNEYEVIEKLKPFDKKKKFTDEILWRIYWKGYLENHKSIWSEYINYKSKSFDENVLKAAEEGKTGIDCFDTWIEELIENNYLHNHSRMWFASIWIFTLKLPWQLGANFFIKNLLDGDAASNTLSWRWVAGLHTNNKPYVATKENIDKYTVNRFRNIFIKPSNQINLIKNNLYSSNKLPIQENYPKSKILIMFDNDLNITNRSKLFGLYSKVFIVSNRVINNELELSEKVSLFKKLLMENINKLIPNSEIQDSIRLGILLNDHKFVDVIYPGVGHNLDLINKYSLQYQIKVNYIYRKEDLNYWKYANSGYYKFKSSFYKLNNI